MAHCSETPSFQRFDPPIALTTFRFDGSAGTERRSIATALELDHLSHRARPSIDPQSHPVSTRLQCVTSLSDVGRPKRISHLSSRHIVRIAPSDSHFVGHFHQSVGLGKGRRSLRDDRQTDFTGWPRLVQGRPVLVVAQSQYWCNAMATRGGRSGCLTTGTTVPVADIDDHHYHRCCRLDRVPMVDGQHGAGGQLGRCGGSTGLTGGAPVVVVGSLVAGPAPTTCHNNYIHSNSAPGRSLLNE